MEAERAAGEDEGYLQDPDVTAVDSFSRTALAGVDDYAIRAYVALGSNLGDRAAALRDAVAEVGRRRGIRVAGVSAVYETEAHTLPKQSHQPAFLNAVVALDTSLTARDLLGALLDTERAMGRTREGGRWAARTIDLDLVLYGDRVVHEAGLTVPHPRLVERRFVLAPLADLAAEGEVPGTGSTVAELLQACNDAAGVARTSLELT
jgi:2-amino-4-hydroxy-6-hydroxymethyldihydropteridine diphosphokinase